MRVTCYTHLPAVKADLPDDFKLGGGFITHLDFDTWHFLDGTFGKSQNKYEKSRPLFFVCEYDYQNGDTQYITDQLDHLNRLLYWAFLLVSGAYLIPNPQMSCIYYQFQERYNTFCKKIGSFEREWIVFGNPFVFNYDEEKLQNIDRLYSFLQKNDNFTNNQLIMHGLRTLQFTANPEFCLIRGRLSYFNGFIHCVSALENILIPEGVRKKYGINITRAFGCNAGALSISEFEHIKEVSEYYSEIYRMRSKVVHGEASTMNYTKRAEEGFIYTRILLTTILRNLIAINCTGFDLNTLPDLLVKASEDKESHHQLFSLIQKGFNE